MYGGSGVIIDVNAASAAWRASLVNSAARKEGLVAEIAEVAHSVHKVQLLHRVLTLLKHGGVGRIGSGVSRRQIRCSMLLLWRTVSLGMSDRIPAPRVARLSPSVGS